MNLLKFDMICRPENNVLNLLRFVFLKSSIHISKTDNYQASPIRVLIT